MREIPGLKITGPLGEGGTATVARAFSEELHKEIAFKYPLHKYKESVTQFQKLAQRENKLIGNLKYPGIVRIFKYCEEPAYLLLELCLGKSLDRVGKINDPARLLSVISSIAASLEFIRINKLIHGDLKPHNIFLPSDFDSYINGHLFYSKISDFSLGRFMDEPETARAGHGTVGYAAPETLAQGKSSHKSDLFALGVIAWQLATGKHPFMEGESDPVKIESRIQENEPEPLDKLRGDLPTEVIELIQSLLSKDENKRPDSAWEVCQNLKEAGCIFPFEKALAPTHLIRFHDNYNEFVGQYLDLADKLRNRLFEITESDLNCLRLVLTANSRRRNLVYSEGRFSFRSNIYWPRYLRRLVSTYFSNADFHLKKEIVRSAIVGDKQTAIETGIVDANQFADVPAGISLIMNHLLSMNFLRRMAKHLAVAIEKAGRFHLAAELYLKSGKFEEAIYCTGKAIENLTDAAHRQAGIHLIDRVFEFAQMTGHEFETRQLLMVKGDIQRTGGDLDSALETYNRITELYNNHPSDKLLAETYRDLGDIHKTKQKFDHGIKVLNRALEIYGSLKDELEESRTLNAIGGIYRIYTDLPNALKFMRRALAIQRRLGAVSDAASSINSMAIIYGTKGKLKRAIALLTISLKMKRTLGDQFEIARTLNNLGYAHQLFGNLIDAQYFLKESLEINRRIGSKNEELHNLWNLSEIMLKCGNLSEAIAYSKDELKLSVSLNIKLHQAYFSKRMGNIHQRMYQFAESESYYEQTAALAAEIDDKVLKTRLLISRSELRYELGDLKAAVVLAEQALQDSVSLKARIEELWALMVLVRILGKMEHLNRAKNIIEELKLDREKLLLEFEYLQFLLEIDAKSDLKRTYETVKSKLKTLHDDIEYPKLLNTAAEIEISCGDKPKGAELLAESRRLAHSKNLVSEEIISHILGGKLAFSENDYEKAFGSYKAALQLCKQASMTIKSDEDKLSFMKKPKMIFLANQIRQLNDKTGSKQKAGV